MRRGIYVEISVHTGEIVAETRFQRKPSGVDTHNPYVVGTIRVQSGNPPIDNKHDSGMIGILKALADLDNSLSLESIFDEIAVQAFEMGREYERKQEKKPPEKAA